VIFELSKLNLQFHNFNISLSAFEDYRHLECYDSTRLTKACSL